MARGMMCRFFFRERHTRFEGGEKAVQSLAGVGLAPNEP